MSKVQIFCSPTFFFKTYRIVKNTKISNSPKHGLICKAPHRLITLSYKRICHPKCEIFICARLVCPM